MKKMSLFFCSFLFVFGLTCCSEPAGTNSTSVSQRYEWVLYAKCSSDEEYDIDYAYQYEYYNSYYDFKVNIFETEVDKKTPQTNEYKKIWINSQNGNKFTWTATDYLIEGNNIRYLGTQSESFIYQHLQIESSWIDYNENGTIHETFFDRRDIEEGATVNGVTTITVPDEDRVYEVKDGVAFHCVIGTPGNKTDEYIWGVPDNVKEFLPYFSEPLYEMYTEMDGEHLITRRMEIVSQTDDTLVIDIIDTYKNPGETEVEYTSARKTYKKMLVPFSN